MSRLVLTQREMNFISDTTKELIKDVVGLKIYYYPINEAKTQTQGPYNEALKKVFDNPIALDCLVDTNFQTDTVTNQFGIDSQFKIEVYLQHRDLVDKNISLSIGDFFSFSDVFYEVAEKVFMRNIYGMPEHKDGVKLIGTKAREEQFKALTLGPTDYGRPDPGAVQTFFQQQRGQPTVTEEINGKMVEMPTGDVRVQQDPNVLGPPITGAKEISQKSDAEHSGTSSFYDED